MAESKKCCSKRKPCTYTACEIALAVRKFIAYGRRRTLEYEFFAVRNFCLYENFCDCSILAFRSLFHFIFSFKISSQSVKLLRPIPLAMLHTKMAKTCTNGPIMNVRPHTHSASFSLWFLSDLFPSVLALGPTVILRVYSCLDLGPETGRLQHV